MPNPIVIAKNAQTELALLPALANRHGCITGATGTGKTVTLQVLAESFSRLGTPVFMADVKGDLTGISQAGVASPKLQERLKNLGLDEPAWGASPVALWDVFGEQGTPVRATITDMGPLLLARILELNDTQEGVLTLVFKVADDEGQLLLDLKDLRAMLQNVADRAAELKTRYGNVSAASVGAIQRGLLALESQGAEKFFGEPMLDVAAVRPVAWGIIVFLALFSTCLAFFLQSLALDRLSSTTVSLLLTGEPVFTALFAYLFLGETLSAMGLLGAAVIVGTVVAATWADGRTGAPAAPAAPVVVSRRAVPRPRLLVSKRRDDRMAA